jgi:hypothetical protein
VTVSTVDAVRAMAPEAISALAIVVVAIRGSLLAVLGLTVHVRLLGGCPSPSSLSPRHVGKLVLVLHVLLAHLGAVLDHLRLRLRVLEPVKRLRASWICCGMFFGAIDPPSTLTTIRPHNSGGVKALRS